MSSDRSLRANLGRWLLPLAIAALLPSLAAAAPRWVNARYLVVRQGQASQSPTLTTLRFGDQVDLLATEASFARIRCAAGEGWVAGRWLAAAKPSQDGGLLARMGQQSRAGGREVGTTAGARGLAPEAQSYAATKPQLASATEQLLKLEALVIADDAIDAFLRDGKLGDYLEAAP